MSRYPKGDNIILEKDIIRKMAQKGNRVKVVAPIENGLTEIYKDGNVEVLYVNTLQYSGDIHKIKKGIAVITRPFFIKQAIKKHYGNEKFDYLVGYTPFMANQGLFRKLKKKFEAKALLFLWDIFPQNAKDLGIIKNNILFNYLKSQEKKMYKIFDKIICNCEGQIDYIIRKNLKEKNALILIRNCENIQENLEKNYNKDKLKIELNYGPNDKIAIFGGNMGKPQDLENLLNMIKKLESYPNLKFIFLGSGTEKERLKNLKSDMMLKNLKILDFIPREKYEKILKICDIGLISLNKNYTVPNFPAKITGYIKQEIPIFASLDSCSIKFLGNFIEKNELGKVANSRNIDEMEKKFIELVLNLKNFKSENFKRVYMENFDLEKAYKKIEKEIFLEEENV